MFFGHPNRSRCAAIAVCLLLGIGVLTVWEVGQAADPLPAAHPRHKTKGNAFQLKQFQVVQSNKEAALKYYKETVSPHLQFLTPDTIETSSIKQLLEYFGYTNIAASDLHRLASDDLMKLSEEGNILATRFFAPKITDVIEKVVAIPDGGFGWRKLVRLKAKPGSKAETNGMETLYFLQNIFEKTIAGDPFDPSKNVSKNNQAIVVRKEGGPYSETKQPIYFFTYGPLVEIKKNGTPIKEGDKFLDDGDISFSLNATFNENDRNPETNEPAKAFFVPDSCIQCHGRSRTLGKVNYLDTDHWIDRVKPNYGLDEEKYKQEDFTGLAKSPYPVLYDGKKDADAAKKSFETLRKLNEEIRDQNSRLPPAGNFQLGAVKRWLELHKPENFGDNHVPPYERGFGTQLWDKNNATHKKLLYSFNRYCYRCHSSVRFNVYDRAAVVARIEGIQLRVTNLDQSDYWMPQDRIFPGLAAEPTGDLKEFLELLSSLQQP